MKNYLIFIFTLVSFGFANGLNEIKNINYQCTAGELTRDRKGIKNPFLFAFKVTNEYPKGKEKIYIESYSEKHGLRRYVNAGELFIYYTDNNILSFTKDHLLLTISNESKVVSGILGSNNIKYIITKCHVTDY